MPHPFGVATAGDAIFFPAGSIVLEAALDGGLFYGVRATRLFRHPTHHMAYSELINMYVAAGRNVNKMREALQDMAAETPAVSPAPDEVAATPTDETADVAKTFTEPGETEAD